MKILGGLLWLVLTLPVLAQPYTIAKVLADVEERNPELAAARADTRQLEAAYEKAGALPNGSFIAGVTRGQGQASLSTFSGLRRDEYLSFEQPFQPFGALKKGEQVALLNLQEAQARLQFTQVALRRRAKDAFYNQLFAQERQRILKSNLELARGIYEATEKRFRGGQGKRSEVLASRVQRNQVEQALISGQGELSASQAELAPLLGLTADTPMEVQGSLDTDYENLPLQDVLALAKASPALVAAQRATEASQEEVALAELQGNPTPSLLALYDFRIPSYIVGAQLSIPLDWGEIGYEVQAKKELAQAQQARLSAAQLEISSEVHKAYATFLAGVRNSASYQREVLQPQEEALKLTQEDFKKGNVDYDQVLLAQQQLESIRVEYLRQQLVERLALNALEEAVGCAIEK